MSLAQVNTIGTSTDLRLPANHLLKQKYPQRHFHYSLKDFFRSKLILARLMIGMNAVIS